MWESKIQSMKIVQLQNSEKKKMWREKYFQVNWAEHANKGVLCSIQVDIGEESVLQFDKRSIVT